MAKAKGKAVAKLRDPTSGEAAAIDLATVSFNGRPARPEPTIEQNAGVARVSSGHADAKGGAIHLQDTFGSASAPFVSRAIRDVLNIVGTDDEGFGAAVALVAAIAPRDELECALAQQMVTAHTLSMRMSKRTMEAKYLPQMNAYANIAAKAQRTFTAQIDALGKLRNGGQQVVRHVHVYEGGQAIVADEFHHHTGAGNREIAGQGQAPFADGFRPAMLGTHPAGVAMPGAARQGSAALSHARRDVSGGTEGE
jgi:hypothetical protein